MREMTSLGEAILDLKADRSQLDSDMRSARASVEGALGGLAQVGGTLVSAGLTAAAAGIATLGGGLVWSVQQAADAEAVQAQLNAVLKSTGGIAGVTAEQVNALADELSRLTPFEDDAIVSAQSMLLTFTNIGQDVFPDATRTILDMSQALGQDLQQSAVQIGKALQDPIQGVTALRRVGVNFTDEQMDMIKAMVEAGDVAGAQRFILRELQTEFGGSAEAAGKTFAGQLKILRTQLGNIGETIGGAVLPVLSQLATQLLDYLARPEVQAGIAAIAQALADFAAQAAAALPGVIAWFQQAFGWLAQNQGVIVGALAAIGVAIAAWVYTTVIPAAIAVISSLAPIIAIMAVVAAAAYLIYEAWQHNFLGIRDTVTTVFTAIKLVFQAFRAALSGDWRGFGELLRQAWDVVWRLIEQRITNAWNTIKQAAMNIVNGVKQAFRIDWGELGRRIIDGIISGLRNGIGAVVQTARNVAKAAGDAVKGFLGIHSPSRLMYEYGQNTARGFALGMQASGQMNIPGMLGISGTSSQPMRGDIIINIENPKKETAEESIRKALKSLSYAGVLP